MLQGMFQKPISSSLRVFISKEQTKENDEKVGVAAHHALWWSTNMHWSGRPPCIVVVDQHALEWSPTMDGGGRPPWMAMSLI
jgi:hypothetical protein